MAFEKNDALKDYVEVNVRIERFWQKYPQGRIETSITLLPTEPAEVLIKADVYRDITDAVPAATGHAHEVKGSSYINRTSFIENGETSAVGRALAILGFEIKKSVASKEEVANAKLQQQDHDNQSRQQDTRQQIPTPTHTHTPSEHRAEPQSEPIPSVNGKPAPLATEAQIKMLFAKMQNAGLSKADGAVIKKIIIDVLGYEVERLSEIRRADVTKLAEYLTTYKKGGTT